MQEKVFDLSLTVGEPRPMSLEPICQGTASRNLIRSMSEGMFLRDCAASRPLMVLEQPQ